MLNLHGGEGNPVMYTRAARITLPIFRRTNTPTQREKPQRPVLTTTPRLPLNEAPCVHTAREATKPCTYNFTTSILNSPTDLAPTQRERSRLIAMPCTYNNSRSSALYSSTQPCVHTARKSTHPCVSGSEIGNPALPPEREKQPSIAILSCRYSPHEKS